MRTNPRHRWTAAALVLLLVAGGVRSAEDDLDIDLMQAIEDTHKGMASHIALKEGKDGAAGAKELTAMFARVEAFYMRKGDAPDAVDLARKSRELAIEIGRQIDSKDFDAATDSATSLARTCKACHNFYKKS